MIITLTLIIALLSYLSFVVLWQKKIRQPIFLEPQKVPTSLSKKMPLSPSVITIGFLHLTLPDGLTPIKLLIMNGALIFISFNISSLLHISAVLLILGILFVEAVVLFFSSRAKTGNLALDAQLPFILGVFARTYRTVPDLSLAILSVERALTVLPTKQLFSRARQRIKNGQTASASLVSLTKESKHPVFSYIGAALLAQKERGADVSTFLESAASVLTTQQHAKREIEQLLFQNKISAVLSALLVPLLLGGLLLLSANYRTILLTHPTGKMLLLGALIWWCIGTVLTYSYTKIRL